MDTTRSAGPAPTLGSPRLDYRRDDEEYETVPRWVWSRLHADLALSDTIAGRMARRVADLEGGQ